ncbi:hypothetical protein KP509_14G047600 [Ceratopteris richardii]|uniref:Integrase catalytic domain-containing protein n=1 Tax=Ceratopteris richardii TaxID=49495 RepID=A0A8T2TEJ5_CERRI|nr:hypothetical protein KP509_14G047600 [Ceratopteris richardii]
MRRGVSDHVRQCQICQHIKNPQQKSGKLTPITVTEPFEIVGWDITFEALMSRLILHHGCPQKLLSDQGAQFTDEVMQVLGKCLGMTLLFTSPYHPQTNGPTERMNKTIKQILNSFIDPLQQNWDQVLPFAVYAYNTSVQASTRVSPSGAFYGQDPKLPPELQTLQVKPKYRDHLPLLRYSLHQNLQIAQKRQKRNYDQGRQAVTYKDRDLVLLYYPIRRTRLSESLLHRWIGPYRILNRIRTNTYRVERRSNGSITTAHQTMTMLGHKARFQ